MQERTYLMRPPLQNVLTSLVIGLGILVMAYKVENESYQLLGVLSLTMTAFLFWSRLMPRHIKLNAQRITFPTLVTGRSVTLNFGEIKGYKLYEGKRRLLKIEMKSGKFYALTANHIEEWESFFKDFASAVPELKFESMKAGSRLRLSIFGTAVLCGLAYAAHNDYLHPKAALYAGGFVVALILFSFFTKQSK